MFSSMVETFKKMEENILEETPQGRKTRMYEIGKKRPDGKFNIWKKIQIGYYWEWVVEIVCDSLKEATDYVSLKTKPKRHY